MRRRSGHASRNGGASHAGALPLHQRRTGTVRHASRGLSFNTVSTIESGAGSVAVSERPTLPNTRSTSGKARIIRSCTWSARFASSIEMLGNVVGM